jgi:hypothetical protein
MAREGADERGPQEVSRQGRGMGRAEGPRREKKSGAKGPAEPEETQPARSEQGFGVRNVISGPYGGQRRAVVHNPG